ncbi:MAG: hypothetical protein JWL82_182 [Parcubacteria group bacterium]|nr:hypothetical protein [Parcubacteria group bacterium]
MKPILFVDFDGTLCHDRFWRTLPPEQTTKIQTFLFETNRERVNGWMRGEYTSEEMTAYVAEHTKIAYEKLWEVFVHDASTMFVEEELLSLILKLRSKYTTVLITVNMDSFDRFTSPALNLSQYFDAIVNSFNEKRFKTDEEGAIFIDIANAFAADITASILIDDSEAACETFKKLGGTAYQVGQPETTKTHLENLLISENLP